MIFIIETILFSFLRLVKITDGEHSVDLAFWANFIHLPDEFEVGTVLCLKNVSVNSYGINTSVRPPNLNYRDLYPPLTDIKILTDDEIPEHLKVIKPPKSTITGTVEDIDDYLPYKSCKGQNGNCRMKKKGDDVKCEKGRIQYD